MDPGAPRRDLGLLVAGLGDAGGMRRKRPCRICRRWFLPDARVGDRQRVCGDEECQRERHRRACEQWRARNPDYDREDRLRRRLRVEAGPEDARAGDALAKVDLEAARDVVELEVFVFVEETARVLADWTRDAVRRQGMEIAGNSGRLPPARAREEMGTGPGPP